MTPSFKKGDYVKTVKPTSGWRRMTQEENNAWYDKFHSDCREGRDVWHDSAGEPRLAPQDTYFNLAQDTVMKVLRARVNAPCGYSSMKGCCQVFNPATGETMYVTRRSLTNSW